MIDSSDDEVGFVPRSQNKSSGAGRLSHGGYSGGKADRAFIGNSLKQSQIILENLAHMLKKNKEGMDKNEIAKWQQRIVSISENAAKVRHEEEHRDAVLTEVLNDVTGKRKENENIDHNEVFNVADFKMKEKIQKFNPADDPLVKKIIELTQQVDEDDEDAILMDSELSDAHLLCPYTRLRMTEPLKNINSDVRLRCIHHISREALNQMCKKATDVVKCPVAACVGKWKLDRAVVDEDFKLRMERFEKMKNIRGKNHTYGTSTSTAAAFEIDDD